MHWRYPSVFAPWFFGALLLISPLTAAAQQSEGVVLQVADGEVVVDLGRNEGVAPDSILRFYRRLVVKHPLTGKEVQDRFPIGTARPAEVGERLTIVRNVGALSRAPQPGDFVAIERLRSPDAVRPAEPAPPTPPRESARALPADDAALQQILRENLGTPLGMRTARFEAFLGAHPESRHGPAVRDEIARLRSLASEARPVTETDALGVYMRRTRLAVAGQPFHFALGFGNIELVKLGRIFVRRSGEVAYEAHMLAPLGPTYLGTVLPQGYTQAEGELEYYVDVVRTDEEVQDIAGSADKPIVLRVMPSPARTAERAGRTRASVTLEQVDFNSVGDQPDHYVQFEADVRYGLLLEADDPPVAFRAFRVGIGSIDGIGGPLEPQPSFVNQTRELAVSYGFAEVEFEAVRWFGLAARVIGGNHFSGPGGTNQKVSGMELRTRFGQWDGTRLVAGYTIVQDLGQRGFTEMHIDTFRRVPMVAGVTVTNLPVAADRGVRLTTQAGWRFTDWFTLSAIVGWNARTINHYGYSVGTSAILEW